MSDVHLIPSLVVQAGSHHCAFRLENVWETMRPLPTPSVPSAPSFVRGLCRIRGSPTVVVDLALLMGDSGSSEISRYVTVRVGNRIVAFAVKTVLGVLKIDVATLSEIPPLLYQGRTETIEAVTARDREMIVVLNTARIVPEAVLKAIALEGAV